MQKWKFEDNRLTHKYTVLLFSSLTIGPMLASLCPNLPSSGIIGMCHHTRTFLVLLSQALILFTHQVNGRFVTGVEEKQRTALVDQADLNLETCFRVLFPTAVKSQTEGGERQELEGRRQRLTL